MTRQDLIGRKVLVAGPFGFYVASKIIDARFERMGWGEGMWIVRLANGQRTTLKSCKLC